MEIAIIITICILALLGFIWVVFAMLATQVFDHEDERRKIDDWEDLQQ
jgi:Na+-translocating ferredoxin:NAD+ oxidoreductase RNF subunit RnfB